nr:hypothetical protein [Zea mays]
MVKIEAMERLNQRKKIKQLRHLILMDIALAFRKGNPIVRPCPIRSKTPFPFQLLHNVPYLIMATIPILHKTKPRSGESSSQLAWNEINPEKDLARDTSVLLSCEEKANLSCQKTTLCCYANGSAQGTGQGSVEDRNGNVSQLELRHFSNKRKLKPS